MLDVVLHWIELRPRSSGVDNRTLSRRNPWEWLIVEVKQRRHPEVLFLAEAFTRPARPTVWPDSDSLQSYTAFHVEDGEVGNLSSSAAELADHADEARPNLFVIRPTSRTKASSTAVLERCAARRARRHAGPHLGRNMATNCTEHMAVKVGQARST